MADFSFNYILQKGALIRNDIDSMQNCLTVFGSTNIVDETSHASLLIQAACDGLSCMVELLILHGACPNLVDVEGFTALMYACGGGHLETCKILVNLTDDINRLNSHGVNALMLASIGGHHEIADVLIKSKAYVDITTPGTGHSALMMSCYSGRVKCVETLVTSGAEICLRTMNGKTAKDKARSNAAVLAWLDPQIQVRLAEKHQHQLRKSLLLKLRTAALQNTLTLSPELSVVMSISNTIRRQEHRAYRATLTIKQHFRDLTPDPDKENSKIVESDQIVYNDFLVSSSSIVTAADVNTTVKLLVKLHRKVKLSDKTARDLRYSSDRGHKSPGYAEWRWSEVLYKVMHLSEGLFETVMEYLPVPRVWNWTLKRIERRCGWDARQAVFDLKCVVDEILCDANIIAGFDQKHMLRKLKHSPQIENLLKTRGLPNELVEVLIRLADNKKNKITLTDGSEATARFMLSAVKALHQWYVQKECPMLSLGLLLSHQNDDSNCVKISL